MLAVRKRRISQAKAARFLHDLANLPIEVEPPLERGDFFTAYSDLMELHRLTAYGAAYLEVVIRRQLPLATFDGALIDACKC